ncbi:hypothetical protein HY489_00900 [Candidatus Woesearchaeota archaeon]|nr:hypothetical protein [Candidatus Woesearchaeota archaeon]
MSTIDEVLQRGNDLCVTEYYRIKVVSNSTGITVELTGHERRNYRIPRGLGGVYFNDAPLVPQGVCAFSQGLERFLKEKEGDAPLACSASDALTAVRGLQSGAKVFAYAAFAYQRVQDVFGLPPIRLLPTLDTEALQAVEEKIIQKREPLCSGELIRINNMRALKPFLKRTQVASSYVFDPELEIYQTNLQSAHAFKEALKNLH